MNLLTRGVVLILINTITFWLRVMELGSIENDIILFFFFSFFLISFLCFNNARDNIVLSFAVGTVLVGCSSSTSCHSIQEVNGPS